MVAVSTVHIRVEWYLVMKRSLRVSESSESHKERLAFASASAGDSKRGDHPSGGGGNILRPLPPGEEILHGGKIYYR